MNFYQTDIFNQFKLITVNVLSNELLNISTVHILYAACVNESDVGGLSVWRSELCALNSQLVLSLNSQDAGVYRNSEAECTSLCHVARLHADQVTISHVSHVPPGSAMSCPGFLSTALHDWPTGTSPKQGNSTAHTSPPAHFAGSMMQTVRHSRGVRLYTKQ